MGILVAFEQAERLVAQVTQLCDHWCRRLRQEVPSEPLDLLFELLWRDRADVGRLHTVPELRRLLRQRRDPSLPGEASFRYAVRRQQRAAAGGSQELEELAAEHVGVRVQKRC